MTHSFSIREAFVFAWTKVKAHSGLLFQAMLVLFALQVVSAIVGKTLEDSMLGVVASCALGVAAVFVGTGLTLISLKLAEGHHVEFKNLFPNWRVVWKFFVAGILSGIVIILPLIIASLVALLAGVSVLASVISFSEGEPMVLTAEAIQGLIIGLGITIPVFLVAIGVTIYLAVRYGMVRYAVLDHAGIVESLRKISKFTRGVIWKLIGFLVLLGLLNLVGALLFLVGLLVTVPISIIAYAHVYLKLKARHTS